MLEIQKKIHPAISTVLCKICVLLKGSDSL